MSRAGVKFLEVKDLLMKDYPKRVGVPRGDAEIEHQPSRERDLQSLSRLSD